MLVAQQILQSLGLAQLHATGHGLPGLRPHDVSTFFQQMAEEIQSYLREQMPVWREPLPRRRGDACRGDGLRRQRPRASRKHANIGISLPGTFEEPKAPGVRRRQARTDVARATVSSTSSSCILDDYVARTVLTSAVANARLTQVSRSRTAASGSPVRARSATRPDILGEPRREFVA